MVAEFSIVEDQPLGEFLIEAGEVDDEQVFVVVDGMEHLVSKSSNTDYCLDATVRNSVFWSS